MRISLNWLRDYLDIKPDADIDLISHTLTMAGLEVEAVEDLTSKSRTFLVGLIQGAKDSGYEVLVNDQPLLVKGPKGLSGLIAVNKFSSKEDGFDGEVARFSNLDLDSSEVIALNQEDGMPENLSMVKGFSDTIFTLGITPNRADALSHLGVSRELGALLDLIPRSLMLTPKEMAGDTHEKVAIEIEDANDCPRYACRVVEVNVSESPTWLKMRLLTSGIRPINNVVDVTNYVMISRGQPLHAFDYDKLERSNTRAKIEVRRAKALEAFTALDGKKLKLCEEDVVISDGEKVLALAGVIGGLDSSVDNNTKTILLESAYFDPTLVRMSARKYGVSTESSYRFERGSDPNGVVDALNYAARLLTEISDAKVCREPIDAYRKRIDSQEVKMRPERAQAILGLDDANFDQDLLRKRFLRLGIETVAKKGDAIYFRVPTYRSDLKREIDLIEEAARMVGYDKVKETSSTGSSTFEFSSKKTEELLKKIRQVLVLGGFSEAINYAFLNQEYQSHFCDEAPIAVLNPLSDRYGVMRLSLIPGLIKNLLHNQRNQEKSIQLFEQGTVFLGIKPEGQKPDPAKLFGPLNQDSYSLEKQKLSGVLVGHTPYKAFDKPISNFDFYHLKGMLCEVFHAVGLRTEFPDVNTFFESSSLSYLHPHESATIVYKNQYGKKILGHCGRIHPQVAQSLDISGIPYVFELDVENLDEVSGSLARFKPFSRYPLIERDVALLVDEEVKVGDIIDAATQISQAKEMLSSVNVFDIYRGKNIDAGKKSVALSFVLKREDRTLTDDEAESFVTSFIDVVKERLGAKVRQ